MIGAAVSIVNQPPFHFTFFVDYSLLEVTVSLNTFWDLSGSKRRVWFTTQQNLHTGRALFRHFSA